MELAVRKDSERFVKQGAYGALQARLRRQSGKLAEIPTVVLSAFDRSTRLLPFLFYDTLMFPAGAGAIANALNAWWRRRIRRTQRVAERELQAWSIRR